VKKAIKVPVIAVARLGDPITAEAVVQTGKADFIALGRTLVSEPQWVNKVRDGEPIRRCLACNTCIDGMRSGAGISCVINGVAGRESQFASTNPPQGQRIAVIGAGPAGLTYASLTAGANTVTVFEKDYRAGGAFRFAGLAPMFNDVEANPASFERYIRGMVAACQHKGVRFRYGIDVRDDPDLLAPFDRIVVATGASYPFGTGGLAMGLLDIGAGHWPVVSKVMTWPDVRDWFYYRVRTPTGGQFRSLAKPGQEIVVIGDAAKAGKSKDAIGSAFEAALLGR
jgi:NADPH-dependent 2,4-dienoyl-CoA reductase/sulfur reductase-like enzyme